MANHPEHVEYSMRVKFQALFDKINEPHYVMDTYYSDNLIHKIIETKNDKNYIGCLTNLLVEPMQNLEKYHASVQVFLVRVLAHCVSNELYFAKLSNDINATLKKAYSEIGSPTMFPSFCVAYFDVALSLVEQHTGLCWLRDTGMWKEIISTNNECKTVFVTRQKYKFLSRLVWRLNGLEDEVTLKEVLNYILEPIFEKGTTVSESLNTDEEEEACKKLEPMLQMLQSILSDYSSLTRSSLVVNTLLNHFKLVCHMHILQDKFRSLVSLISRLIFRLVLARALHNKPLTGDTIYTAEDFMETSVVFFNTVNLFITRRNAILVLDYCYSCNETWNGVWNNQKPNISTLDGKKIDVQNKMLFLCLVPAISYITRHMPDKAMQMQGSIQDYIMKLINASCEHTAKTAMRLGELTLELDTDAIVLQSVKRLSSLINSMNKEQANLMFQGLFHVLKKFEPPSEDQNEKTPGTHFQEDQENQIMYTYVIETIYLLVNNYDIKWIESLEVLCLYSVAYNVLKNPNLSNKVWGITILLAITSEYSQLTKSSLVVNALLNHFKVVNHLYLISGLFRKDNLSSLLANLTMRLIMAKTLHYKPFMEDTIYSVEDFVEISAVYFNALGGFISRGNVMLALDYGYTCNEVWNALWLKTKPEVKSYARKVNVQNKMLFLSLVPPITYVMRNLPTTARQQEGQIQDYIMKLIHATCEHTAKAAIALSDLVLEMDTEAIVLKSVKRLSTLINSMNNEQANLIFQGLFYVLKEFAVPENLDKRVPRTEYQSTEDNLLVFSYVLETILLLVKNYDIHWQESLEIVCLYNVVYHVLEKPNLSTKFIVTALNVIAVTVRKFLPPNLSLLMESRPGSAMHDLGRLIYMKLHDMHWEVRDSALELLLDCTEISYIKFPPFQKQIIENDLIVVATAVALNDHEFYARSTALRCIGAACKVNAIWDHLRNKQPDIQDSLLNVLRDNQEGIVRKDACNVLCEIYLNVKLCPDFKQKLFEQMVSSAISDFHWEVQLAALKFWKIVIHNSLCEQGMLDGTFPPVTFSKESRKIVNLNKVEIQRRLIKSLAELAAKGCLTVLTTLLHEDTEVEIMDANLSIALDLLDILKRYEVPECLKPVEGEPQTIQEYYNEKIKEDVNDDDVVIKTEESSDNVIESIVNADDMNLLAHIYERHMKLQNERPELTPKPTIKLMRYVQPYLFVNHLTSKDFKAVIEYKKQWRNGIRSVESLLDDVLGIYEISQEVNNLDCY